MKTVFRMSEVFFYVKDRFSDRFKQTAAFCAVFLVGAILGARNGVRSSEKGLTGSGSFACLYIAGKVNIFSFILLSLLSAALVYALICALSGNKLTYWVTLIVFFAFPFGIASHAVVFVSVFKLVSLPYVILCFVPFRLCLLFCLLLVWLIATPKPAVRYCGGLSIPAILDNARDAAPVGIVAGALIIAEGALTFILTFGFAV